MTDIDIRQQHAIQYQLQAIRLGAVYGALALAGLIAVAIYLERPLGALLAIVSALCAYVNFTIVAADAQSVWIGRTQILALTFGAASGVFLLSYMV